MNGVMEDDTTNPMETLRQWDEICRDFGCSEDQIRELYFLPDDDELSADDAAALVGAGSDVLAKLGMELVDEKSGAELLATEPLN